MICQAIKPDGTPCKARSLKDGLYCFRHDPESQEKGLVASIKGGENRRLQGVFGEPQQLTTPHDIKDFLGLVINKVWSGEIPVQVGTSLGFLSRCWLDSYEKAEVEDTLKNFDERLKKADL